MASVNGVSVIIDGTVAYANGKVGTYHAQGVLSSNASIIWSIDNPNSKIHFENAYEETSDQWGAVISQVARESMVLTSDDGHTYPIAIIIDNHNNRILIGSLSTPDFDNDAEISQWMTTILELLE